MRRTLSLTSMLAFAGSLFAICAFVQFIGKTDAAPSSMPPLQVLENNVDDNGHIRVHEQGVVSVTGAVTVGNLPGTQNVSVTNSSLPVTGEVTLATKILFDEELFPFTADAELGPIDISPVSKVRVRFVVNGSGTVNFRVITDGGFNDHLSIDASGSDSRVYDLPGTQMLILVSDPDGEQVFVTVFGR